MYIVRRAHSRIDQVAPVEGNEQAWMDQLDFVGRAQLVINPGHPSRTLILSLIFGPNSFKLKRLAGFPRSAILNW